MTGLYLIGMLLAGVLLSLHLQLRRIRQQLGRPSNKGTSIMSALDDLKAAAGRLITDVKAIADKLANDDSADEEALAKQLNDAADAAEAIINPPQNG